MKLRVCLSGATGNVGQELIKEILKTPEIELVSCIGFSSAGKRLPEILNFEVPDLFIHNSVKSAYDDQSFDVLIDYTNPKAVYQTIMDSISFGVHCVIGTSGLSDSEYEKINEFAKEKKVGVFAAGNYSITSALMTYFSQITAKFVPHWELFDYGSDSKADAPSGTTRELAYLLSKIREPEYKIPTEDVYGYPETRGASINGSQVHSIRLPGYYSSSEAVFGLPGERISIRHDSMSYAPYVAGTLMAVKKIATMKGLTRGMGDLLGFDI